MKKETQGRTDLYIGSWLKSRPRDKVLNALLSTLSVLLFVCFGCRVCSKFRVIFHDYFQYETMLLNLNCLALRKNAH